MRKEHENVKNKRVQWSLKTEGDLENEKCIYIYKKDTKFEEWLETSKEKYKTVPKTKWWNDMVEYSFVRIFENKLPRHWLKCLRLAQTEFGKFCKYHWHIETYTYIIEFTTNAFQNTGIAFILLLYHVRYPTYKMATMPQEISF